jgi:glycosyltransferase involved in cell wall biosynthesis
MCHQESPRKPTPPTLTILGVHIKSDAYPNVKYKVEQLLREKSLAVRELDFPLPYIQRFGQQQSGVLGVFRRIGAAVRFGYAHVRAIIAAITLDRPRNLYIPYPAVFVLYLLSLLPARWRPDKMYADAFISIYDTVVTDRGLVSSRGAIARLLYSLERRAYQGADMIFVDTEINARYLSNTFNVDAARVMALPLSINEDVYTYQPYIAKSGRCNVLFIGTFVPLQGVEVIARTIAILHSARHIHFRLIGSGQTSGDVATILKSAGCTNVSWVQNWQSASALAEEIQKSDICLGIFGNNEKTQRVWPLKNYAYMATGRAIITGDTSAARTMLANCADKPFMIVRTGNPEDLARAITELAEDSDLRTRYATNSRLCYEKRLANSVSLKRLLDVVTDQQKTGL